MSHHLCSSSIYQSMQPTHFDPRSQRTTNRTFIQSPSRRLAPVMVTLSSAICVPKFNCGAGGMMWWENMSHLNVEGMVQRGSWVMVDPGLLHQAIAKIRVNAEWGCGPNSSARAAILLNAHIGNWVWFVDHCPRTFGLPLGIPEPWWKVGPAPESLAEYLGKCSELHNFWPRSAGESDWNAMLAHFKHHLKGCRPVIVLLSLEMARQHYVCVVEIDESRQCAAVLNTDGALFEAPLDDLKNRMD